MPAPTWRGAAAFGAVLESGAQSGPDEASEAEQKDADFVLMTGRLAKFLPDLVDALGGEAAG